MGLQLKENLKIKLKTESISLPTLAKKTGISRKTLSNWIEGQKPQNLEQVKIVAEYFGLTVDELCFGPTLKAEKPLISELEKHREEINAGIFEVVLRRVSSR